MVPSAMPQSTVRKSYPESPRGPMALPLVLLRDKNQDLTHEQCLIASFAHMTTLMKGSHSGEWAPEWQKPWDQWKTGKFRKIVKRANPQRFAALAQDPQTISTSFMVGDELIEILSLPPYSLSEPDPRVKPLQVAGLDYAKGGEYPAAVQSKSGLVLAYDGSLGASTGKMMAQAAHAAQLLSLREPNWELNQEPLRVVDGFEQEGIEWILEVVDAGFTEVAPNSTTIKLGRFIG